MAARHSSTSEDLILVQPKERRFRFPTNVFVIHETPIYPRRLTWPGVSHSSVSIDDGIVRGGTEGEGRTLVRAFERRAREFSRHHFRKRKKPRRRNSARDCPERQRSPDGSRTSVSASRTRTLKT
ncbi:hypothetical protein K0M31_012714 [Melipona bicolor]|uniref:Uncharacterized protein n=1 Tax=Melipona bicolor TaxID=60889 RepID=A0AA40KH14_9HYME|nr:hypothetical protein K0M31_012714 [Melipona bicolor]